VRRHASIRGADCPRKMPSDRDVGLGKWSIAAARGVRVRLQIPANRVDRLRSLRSQKHSSNQAAHRSVDAHLTGSSSQAPFDHIEKIPRSTADFQRRPSYRAIPIARPFGCYGSPVRHGRPASISNPHEGPTVQVRKTQWSESRLGFLEELHHELVSGGANSN